MYINYYYLVAVNIITNNGCNTDCISTDRSGSVRVCNTTTTARHVLSFPGLYRIGIILEVMLVYRSDIEVSVQISLNVQNVTTTEYFAFVMH